MTNKTNTKENDLKRIPGVGINIQRHLKNIGIHAIADLRGKNPEDLYIQDCLFKGFWEDRCILYVFRLAVYFAENDIHEPEKLKWWYWKDKEYPCHKSVKLFCGNMTYSCRVMPVILKEKRRIT